MNGSVSYHYWDCNGLKSEHDIPAGREYVLPLEGYMESGWVLMGQVFKGSGSLTDAVLAIKARGFGRQ